MQIEQKESKEKNTGLVVKNTGSHYIVESSDGREISCKLKGNFRLKGIRSTNPIAVGDKVIYLLQNDGTGLITEIIPRNNYIIRKSTNLSKDSHIIASNIDLCFLIITIKHPETSTVFIDRFIATAEAYNIPICIVINKMDIYKQADLNYADKLAELYEYIGYPCIKTSCVNNEGIAKLKNMLKGKTVLFSGNSGVGKSTLINTLAPNVLLKTAQISDSHHMGMHTTTFSEMIRLQDGAYLIDTPGIKGFGMYDMDKEQISHYFKDIFEVSKNCRFNNCIHINEPNCAVLEAVERHEISTSRYESYLSMMNEEKEEKYR